MAAEAPPRYGVIGNPVAHSLSPQIHAAFAAQTGVALTYERVVAPFDQFVPTVQAFIDGGARGVNVTVPFKLDAFAWCADRVSPRARRAGAVNCLVVDRDVVRGDNTDGVGLVDDLHRLLRASGRSLRGSRLLLLGAGGAARGVLGPLLETEPATVVVVNRDRAKADALVAAEADGRLEARGLDALVGTFDVIVNATSASLGGNVIAVPDAVLGRAHLVYDMMYGRAPTPFLATASRAGAEATADGLGMLVEQAAESFHVWHGRRPATAPVLAMLRALLATP